MKRNKIRYQSKTREKILIALSGNVYLQYADDEAIAQSKKGDLLVYPQNEALNTTRQGEYRERGFSGYFKVDVSDGKSWQPMILTEIFPGREHHFSKSERPIDTYALCVEMLSALKGKALLRTYREHYELDEKEE